MSSPDDLKLCEELLDDIGIPRPFYLVDEAVAEGLEMPPNFYGFAGATTWSHFGDVPGFATVIRTNDPRIRNGCALQATVMHELCHWLPSASLVEVAYAGQQAREEATLRARIELLERRLTNITHAEQMTEASRAIQRPWDGHCPRFARLASHVHWRAWQRGWQCEQVDVYRAEWYAMPSLREFHNHLDGEEKRLSEIPLTEIDAIQPPKTFTDFEEQVLRITEQRYQEEQNGNHAI